LNTKMDTYKTNQEYTAPYKQAYKKLIAYTEKQQQSV
jgi:hypothetical protein